MRKFVAWTLYSLFTIAIVPLFMHPLGTPRHSVRTEVCGRRLRKIASALESYHKDHGHFPPAVVNDADGNPMHSWRVLILPYLGEEDLYSQYDLSQSWNSPANSKLAGQTPWFYRCPTTLSPTNSTSTDYFAIAGSDTAWSGTKTLHKEDIHDGLAATVLIAETECDPGVHWMEPKDLAIDEFLDASDSANALVHPHLYRDAQEFGRHVLMADGTVRFVPKTFPRATLESLLTINGGEGIDIHSLGLPTPNKSTLHKSTPQWKTNAAYAVLVFSIVVFLFATRRKAKEPPAPEKQ